MVLHIAGSKVSGWKVGAEVAGEAKRKGGKSLHLAASKVGVHGWTQPPAK